jgi:hypothetical protein
LQFICTKLHLKRSISVGAQATAVLISVQSVLNWTRSAGFARGYYAFVAQTRRIIRVLQGGSRSFKLATDPQLAFYPLDATVVDGRVRLRGTLPTDRMKELAESIAKSIRGVKSIDNEITVRPG